MPLLATGQDGYLLYIVMPFIPGVTLRSVIRSASGRKLATEPFPTFETLFVAASKVESKKRTHATGHPVDPGSLGSLDASEIALPSRVAATACRPTTSVRSSR